MLSLKPDARILVVRLSAIGDVVCSLPVVNALRAALPRAFLAWVVEGRAADLLRGHQAIDELVVVPRRWLRSPRAVVSLARKLRGLKFDVAIDVQGLSKSAIAARLSGARRRIGFDGKDGREISRWLNNELVFPTRARVVERNLELLAPLGLGFRTAQFNLDDTPGGSLAAGKILESARLGDRFALINPGAGWPSKLWPAERYAAVARHLGQAHLLRSLVVWSGAAERGWAEQIVAGSSGLASLAPATNLNELAALARRATIFIGSDSGPLHLAAAVGTACVGLFGPSAAERNGPYGPQNITVQKVCLSGGSRRRRKAGGESMAAISAADVSAACDQIFAENSGSRVEIRAIQDVRPPR